MSIAQYFHMSSILQARCVQEVLEFVPLFPELTCASYGTASPIVWILYS